MKSWPILTHLCGSRRDGQRVPLHRVHFEKGALGADLEVIANRFGKKLDADNPNSDRRNFGF